MHSRVRWHSLCMNICLQAMAVGAQMKIAHKLRSAEHITQKEMENILATSLAASKIAVQAPPRIVIKLI